MNATLLVELFVEELPPKALKRLGEAFATALSEVLQKQGLVADGSQVTPYASPRRLGASITRVLSQAPQRLQVSKLMPVTVAYDAQGQATPALVKKLQALGLDESVLPQLKRVSDGKAEVLMHEAMVNGVALQTGLQLALDEAVSKLPIPKVMTYQLFEGCELPGWSSVKFVRPAHGLVALHGDQVVPVSTLGLQAGRTTQGHRFEAKQSTVSIAHADEYDATLREQGAVIASFDDRRASIVEQLQQAATRLGPVHPVQDDALLDEVTALVERPNVLLCSFEEAFLQVPQEGLILTMKANQKYFPLLDAHGKLTHHFLVVSNIQPADPSAVIQGNERVIRPRLADAQFFFDQDRKKSLRSRLPQLDKVVYHAKLGSQGQRALRVQRMAHLIVSQLRMSVYPYTVLAKDELDVLDSKVQEAAQLAKADLLTDMVGEFPELQGIMGAYYARHEGLRDGVAIAIEDHYKPRFAGDDLPRNHTGTVLALADKLETLIGLFGVGQLPTGDKDPFALRRHALGVLRILIEKNLAVNLPELLHQAAGEFGELIEEPTQALLAFFDDRLAGMLREQGYTAQEVDAVLAVKPERMGEVPRRLLAVRAFAALPESAALASANKRVTNILKKVTEPLPESVDVNRFTEAAEKDLWQALQAITLPVQQHIDAHDYEASLKVLAGLRAPVDRFFDDVMVNAEDLQVRLNRLALLRSMHGLMNQVADLSRLAV